VSPKLQVKVVQKCLELAKSHSSQGSLQLQHEHF